MGKGTAALSDQREAPLSEARGDSIQTRKGERAVAWSTQKDVGNVVLRVGHE